MLINAGADLNIPNKNCDTPAHTAIINCNKDLVELLVNAYLQQNNSSNDYLIHLIDFTYLKLLNEDDANQIKSLQEIIHLLKNLNELKNSTATTRSSNQNDHDDDAKSLLKTINDFTAYNG